MKTRSTILIGLSLSALVSTVLLTLHGVEPPALEAKTYDPKYLTLLYGDELHNGDFFTSRGTRLHFNEEGVIEGSNLLIAPLGGLYLTTPINGLHNVEVDLYRRGDEYETNFNFAWCSAPYEAMDCYDGSIDGPKDFTTENCDDLPPRYFSITNPSTTKFLRVNTIAIRYQCESNFNSIVKGSIGNTTYAYDDEDAPRTLDLDIFGASIDLDKFDRGYDEINGHEYPGSYPICFSAYAGEQEDHAFQFSQLENYTVKGMQDGRHAVTFHYGVEHAFGEVKGVANGVDFTTGFPTQRVWDAPINDFTHITEDRHYYPVMNAFGFDPNGHCGTVSMNWYMNEGHVEMPAPDQIEEGYQFVGWYLDESLSTPYDPERTYDYDLVLFARLVKSDYPIRPIYYYDNRRNLDKIDYAVLDQVSGDQHYGSYTVGKIYDDAFYHNGDDTVGYCQTESVLNITEREGPVTILTITDNDIINHRDYHVEYRTEQVTGDTFHTLTHFSDRKGYREFYDWYANVDRQLPTLPFHVKEDETYKTITSTDGYVYPYARRNTYLDDMDALTEIGAYAYACYAGYSAKPLYGLSGHKRVSKVGRRAFFNRFGLADHSTYFPSNAKIFDTEAYANVFFNNNILMLPNSLQQIGARCFMGCQNLNRVYLPLSLKSVGVNAFATGTYDEEMDEFTNITNSKRIDFYYQGTESQYRALPLSTRERIEDNARSITYNVDLHMHAATDYFDVFDWQYTQKYLPEEQEPS